MGEFIPDAVPLSAAELDRRLEKAVHEHERAEKLICFYLYQIKRNAHYVAFGFENVYDYALERFGFCRSKTRALLYLARRLTRLPRLTEALAEGRLGWTKAAKAASRATPETDAEWTEKAVNNSFRDLERLFGDGIPANGGRVSFYMTAEQASVWTQAVELVRRLSGEEVDLGIALEYVAGEFLATYQARVEQDIPGVDDIEFDVDNGKTDSEVKDEDALAPEPVPEVENRICPEKDGELPSVDTRCYAEIHRNVLERDGYRCLYPGCSVRHGLHVHHISHRSKFGNKKWWEMNDPANLVTLCWFHHRMLHGEVIDLSGKAPAELAWRRPKLMETAYERHEKLARIDDGAEALADEDMEVGETVVA